MNVRTRFTLVVAATGLAVLGACSDDPIEPIVIPPGSADITQDITASRTLFAETTYTLKGFIHVTSGATLTIMPGTTIEGESTDPLLVGSSLFILRGAKINAVGTAANPIVFTSSKAAGQRQPGDWGGLIIVGNAPVNRTGLDVAVEGSGTATGAPVSGQNYPVNYVTAGGNNVANDDSGELRYVRVEFAGYAPTTNAELNSFTFAAVGSATRLSYLQAIAGLDDSFEFFGGGADADHLVSYEAGDDHFDISEGYKGRLQFLIAMQSTQLTPRSGAGANSSDPQGIENDGCSGTGCTNGFNSTPLNTPVVANFVLVGTNTTASSGTAGGVGMMLRRGTGGYYVNGVVARWPRAAFSITDQDTYTRAGSTGTPDMATTDFALRNILTIESPTMFQATAGTNIRFTMDATANVLTAGAATTAATFTAFPATITATTTEAAFDWTPAAGSAAASGGLATFTGKLATAATGASPTGNTVTGTSYIGVAAAGGAKWWQGWTKYFQN